jgi:predicted dehydrogenase
VSERIRLGLVGLNFGAWIIENQLLGGPGREHIELTAVCDLNAERVAQWSGRLGVAGYTDFSRMLEDPAVEAVGLFTGPVGRAALIEQAISAGRDVFTTKPFERDSAAAAAVLEHAARLGRVVQLNSPPPTLPADLAQAARWVEQYNLGRPVAYRAATWCSYREKADGSWYDDPLLCPAAPIFRLGIYLINDIARFYPAVTAVRVLQSRVFTGRPTADNAQLSILHEGGAIGSIFSSFCVDDRPYYRCSLELNFERGTIYRNLGPLEENVLRERSVLGLSALVDGKQVLDSAEICADTSGYQWDVFHRCVHGERVAGLVSSEQIVSAIRTLELMRAELEAGRGGEL